MRHFLEVERARAARHCCPILVAVVGVRPTPHRVSAEVATAIFAGLSRELRDVDVIGWLREHRIAGAILAAGPRHPIRDDSRTITRRLEAAIVAGLTGADMAAVRVRVIQIPPG